MKIARITTRLVPPRWTLIRIETDDGLVGYGEPTLEGHARTALMAVEEMSRVLIGEDPRRIEHLWQSLYRGSFYRGGPILCSAISGIEQALWDIVGKHYQTPIYNLLGGAVRSRIRMYAHAGWGDTPEQAAANARRLVDAGFTAIKAPMVQGATRVVDAPSVIDAAVDRIGAMREAVGRGVDIGIDCHGRLSPAMAVRFAKAVEPFEPMFVEEPVLPENVEALEHVVRHVDVPIATGERLFTKFAFRRALETGIAVVQPDLSHAGGILETKKIAAMAESWYAGLAPHCPLGPVALAASLQTDACCPNFLIQEHTAGALGESMLKQPLVVKDGYIDLPTGPGLGIEIDEQKIEAMEEHNWCTPQLRHADDESVADW